MEPGDKVWVTTDTLKKTIGIISHVTPNNELYIIVSNDKTQQFSSSIFRTKVLSKDIRKCIKLIDKRNPTEILSPVDLQNSISDLLDSTNPDIYALIGLRYETGSNGFPVNFKQSLSWYKSGFELDQILCLYQLASISSDYYNNFNDAEKYYNIGIDKGYLNCAYALNVMYRNNKYIKNSKEKELFYIKKCIEYSNGKDCSSLLDFAVCQLTMKIPDYSEAYKYLNKAFELNKTSIGVQQFLAIVLYRGLGCNKNEDKAIKIHKELANKHNSECSKMWMTVYNARKCSNIIITHPLRDTVYNALIDVIDNGDSHTLYYGNWINIIKYHAFNNKSDVMSGCLFICINIFGCLNSNINIKQAQKYIMNISQNDVDLQQDYWIKCWIWFFNHRYRMIKKLTGLHLGIVDVISKLELSLLFNSLQ